MEGQGKHSTAAMHDTQRQDTGGASRSSRLAQRRTVPLQYEYSRLWVKSQDQGMGHSCEFLFLSVRTRNKLLGQQFTQAYL